jgi:hypothetical protein
MGKLRARDRGQLVVIAYKLGLARPAGSAEYRPLAVRAGHALSYLLVMTSSTTP